MMAQRTTSISKIFSSKHILGKITLALFSTCLTLLILEIIARLLPLPYPVNTGAIFACAPSLGWTGAPNFHDIFEDTNFRQELIFNSQGMHDTEHALEKAPHTFRLLMLGDSFVQAVQVGEAETAHQVLEDNLNRQLAAQSQFEVISAGVVNWGTNQQLIYYREHGRQFQPDLVLLMFYIGNDFADNLPGNVLTIKGFNCYAPYSAVCDNKLTPSPLTYAPGFSRIQGNCSPYRRVLINSLGRLYQHSRLYQQIEPLLLANRPREVFGQKYPLAYTALYLPNTEVELEQAYQITQATLTQLRQEVEADGSQFAVALIPPWPVLQLILLSPDEQAAFLKANPQFVEADANRPNRRMAEFFNNQNTPFIDLTEPLVKYSAAHARAPLYLIGEGHWTAEGNRTAADILAQWLVQNDLFRVE